ncbi:ABC transporter ATP-binding protein [Morganella psychrotolerans]|uniref:ABC transporter ATP-binding protein n=1 Tax=Morganella psychrotolerans TaxID=368603 RepID=UPI0039AFA7AA
MITVKNMHICKQGKTLISIDNLNLPDKGSIALIGPNGSGKSTLINALSGLNREVFSSVTLNGKNIAAYRGAARIQQIGLIPQSFNPCWDQQVDELITLAAERATDPAQAKSTVCQKYELIPLLNKHWHILSGGEKSRVLTAMALMCNPPVIFADEPGAALDIKHRMQLIEDLTTQGKDKLVIVCLHELDMVFRYFESVILLSQGQLRYFGLSAELIDSPLLSDVFDVRFKKIEMDGYCTVYADRIVHP